MLLTNGVDEAIHLMCCTFLEAEDEALIATPSFFMYDVNIQMMTPHLKKVQADATLEFPYERFMAAITERTKLIIVASPNNPTGAVVSREHLLAIAAAAPQAVLMVDEAYYHFDGASVMEDLAAVPNLIVARTFSKAYGLANLRSRNAGRQLGVAEVCAEGEFAVQRERRGAGLPVRWRLRMRNIWPGMSSRCGWDASG